MTRRNDKPQPPKPSPSPGRRYVPDSIPLTQPVDPQRRPPPPPPRKNK